MTRWSTSRLKSSTFPRRAAKMATQTTASTAVTMAMQTATNFSRSLRIMPPIPLVDKFVEIV